MDTDFSYMLTFSNLILKLNTGEDCASECEEIKTFSEQDQESIVMQLLSMLDQRSSENIENIVAALKSIGYLDSNYVDDFAEVAAFRTGGVLAKEKVPMIQRIIGRNYGRTLMEDVFWRTLTLIVVNAGDNTLLAQYIEKLEEEASQE